MVKKKGVIDSIVVVSPPHPSLSLSLTCSTAPFRVVSRYSLYMLCSPVREV